MPWGDSVQLALRGTSSPLQRLTEIHDAAASGELAGPEVADDRADVVIEPAAVLVSRGSNFSQDIILEHGRGPPIAVPRGCRSLANRSQRDDTLMRFDRATPRWRYERSSTSGDSPSCEWPPMQCEPHLPPLVGVTELFRAVPWPNSPLVHSRSGSRSPRTIEGEPPRPRCRQPALLDDQLGDEQLERGPSRPPVTGELLASGANQIATRPGCEVAGNRRLQINACPAHRSVLIL